MGGSVNTESVLFAVSDHESAHIVYLFLRRRRKLRVGPKDFKVMGIRARQYDRLKKHSWIAGSVRAAAVPRLTGENFPSGVADSRGTLDGYCFLGFVSTSVIQRWAMTMKLGVVRDGFTGLVGSGVGALRMVPWAAGGIAWLAEGLTMTRDTRAG